MEVYLYNDLGYNVYFKHLYQDSWQLCGEPDALANCPYCVEDGDILYVQPNGCDEICAGAFTMMEKYFLNELVEKDGVIIGRFSVLW